METRKKKKIDYSEMLGAEEDYYGPEKILSANIKARKRRNDSLNNNSKPSKSAKKDMRFYENDTTANWEEVVVKEEMVNSDSDDLQSEDEDIEKQMEDASNYLETCDDFIPKKMISKKFYSEDIKLPLDLYLSQNSKVGDKCNFINYVHGYLKILLNGYVYFCNRVVDNIFYWQCDQNKDCISQAVTMYNDGKHSIKSLDEHSHSPEVSGNCCLKDSSIAMYLPMGIKQSSFEMGDVKKNRYLVRNGYFYVRKKTEDDIDFWVCEHYKSEGCKGGILTIKNEGQYYVKYANEHNHVNDLKRQYKCIEKEDELPMCNIETYFPCVEKQENDHEDSALNNDANDSDGANYNGDSDPNDPDYDLESNPGVEDNGIFIKKENYSDEDDIIESELDESKGETTEIVCDFINSQRGNPKLCINGYMYTLNRKTKSSYWTCEFKKKKSIDCKAMACTIEREDGKHVVQKMTDHNHPPRTDRKTIGQILNRIREKCIERTDLTASEVVESETGALPVELLEALPSRSAIYRMISRKRRLEEAALGGSKIYERKELKKLKCDLDIETSFEVKDTIVCKTVESSRGNNKLIVDDYLFNLSRVAGNNHYWRCEQRVSQKCVGFAITNCNNGVHYLKNIREHNHESQKNRKFVVQAMNTIKERALKTDEDAILIVEDALKDISEEVLRELPTKETLIRKVNRTRYLYKPKPATDEHSNKDDAGDEKSHIYEISVELGTPCQLFSPTNKGNFKLNLDGYFYHKNRINNEMHYWQCEDNKHYKCKGVATTVCTDNGQHILKKARKHNHPPKQSRQDIAQIIQKIKEKAKTTNEDSSLIYNDEVEHLPDEIKNLLPQRCSILSMINRIRKQNCDGEDKKEPIKYDDEYEHIFEIKQSPDTECEFVESKRGFEKLTIEGYLFVRNKIVNDIHKWRCDDQKPGVPSCRAYATTYIKNGKHYLKKAQNHNHPADESRIEIAHLISKIKKRATTTNDLSTKIFDEEFSNLSDEIKKKLPHRENILHMINRIRKKINELPTKSVTQKVEGSLENHFHEPFVEPGSEVEVVICHKGTRKLNLNGYLYVKNAIKNNVHYWTCEEKHSGKCKGCATTTADANDKHFLRTTRPHNHLAKAGNQKEIADVMNRVKERALNSDDGPKKIYNEFIQNLPKELKAVLPTKEAIIMIIKRHRRKFRPIDHSGVHLQPQKIYPPEIVEIIDRMKQKIATTTEGPVKVYNSVLANVPLVLREQLPQRHNVLQTLKRHRRKCKMKGMYPNGDNLTNDADGNGEEYDTANTESEDDSDVKPFVQSKSILDKPIIEKNDEINSTIEAPASSNDNSNNSGNNSSTGVTPEVAEMFWRFGEHPRLFQ
ncbi:uncharacterized protein LOC129613271 isoform X1 [Condylostylus longicornis]|uniref:uncharacterized protein LOC129613271 isoform X1 n=1 Tax=Condylostylus longicornis TaxID=2530218 RepID=UPI00244E4783|nr:uncharacterized protein LOC129613271 isoform X1 [Condylostylus longicornis]